MFRKKSEPEKPPLGALKTAAGLLAAGLGMLFCVGVADAQDAGVVRIGLSTDLSAQYADLDGKGGVTAAQMAIDDFGGKVLGKKVELLVVDHQNKPDIAAAKVREWFDTRDVTMVIGGTKADSTGRRNTGLSSGF